MKDKHIVALLEIQLKHDIKMEKIEKAIADIFPRTGIEIHEMFSLDLVDIVADILGVAKDNYFELDAKYNMDAYILKYNETPKEYYSRDWVWDRWIECRALADPVNSFINTMMEDVAEYYKEKEC